MSGELAGARRRLRAWADALRRTPLSLPTLRPRRRRVTVRTRPAVPGWALRVLAGAVALACVLLAGGGPTLTTVGVVLAALLVVRPGGVLPVVVLGWVAFVATTAGDGSGAAPFAVLAGTHLVLQLGAVLGRTSWAVRVELAALLVPARRFLAVQVAAQLVALLAAAVARGRLEVPWLAPLAAVGLLLVVVGLAPRLSRPPRQAVTTAPGVELLDRHPG